MDSVKLTAKSDTVTPTAQTLSATVPSSGVYMLIISKNESGGGTVIINSFTFTPSSNNGTVAGTYKSTVYMNGEVYMIFTIKDDGTWLSQGYTDNTYTEPTLVGTIKSGSYVQSGNTITLSGTTYGNINFTGIICTTNDNWNTMTISGTAIGTATKQQEQ